MILKTGRKKIGVLGLSFKPGTDDLRESPMVYLVETLIGKGCDVIVFDKCVAVDSLIGSNRVFITEALPHLASLLRDSLDEVVQNSDVLVIGQRYPELMSLLDNLTDHTIIDLVRIHGTVDAKIGDYVGICW